MNTNHKEGKADTDVKKIPRNALIFEIQKIVLLGKYSHTWKNSPQSITFSVKPSFTSPLRLAKELYQTTNHEN